MENSLFAHIAHAVPVVACARAGGGTVPAKRGFALVIALVIMGMLLVLVISIVMFTALELRLTATYADRQIARLNAVYSLRLALAQLQQEAGPDQRVTAQANVTVPITAAGVVARRAALRSKWNNKNPYHTGVWNTRQKAVDGEDDPTAPPENGEDLPPAWLVSGEKQFNTPADAPSPRAYEDGYKTPWTRVEANSKEDVILFKSLPEKLLADTERFPFDTRVTAAKVAIKDAERNTVGNYAYWVADEGVKARLNMQNIADSKSRDFEASAGTGRWLARANASGRAAFELFPDWTPLQSDDTDITNAITTPSFAAHKKLESYVTANTGDGAVQSIASLYAHDVTAYSQGLLTDVRFGGLKWDLSCALEMPWEEFKNSVFWGSSNQTPVSRPNPSVVMDATTQWLGGPGQVKNTRVDPKFYSMPTLVTRDKYITTWPVYSVGFTGNGAPSSSSRAIRGPTWNVMRDYYRLYKTNADGANDDLREYDPTYANEVQNFVSTPAGDTLAGRTIFPNVLEFGAWGVSHIAAADSVGCDLWTCDIADGGSLAGRPQLRILKTSTAPYNSRYVTTLGLSKMGGQLRLVCIPAFTLHNPFNVPVYYRGGYIHTDPYFGTPRFQFKVGENDWTQQFSYLDQLMLHLFVMPDVVPASDRIIPPGQTLVYSPKTNGVPEDANPQGRQAPVQCEIKMRYRDGVFVNLPLSGESIANADSVLARVDFRTSGTYLSNGYFVREHIISWGRDIQKWAGGSASSGMGNLYLQCSELTEQYARGFSYVCAGRPMTAAEMETGKAIMLQEFPNSTPFAAVEYFEKPANWSKAAYGEEQAVNNGYPLWIFSNPLASARRPDTNCDLSDAYSGRATVDFGYRMCSPSWHFRYRSTNTYEGAIEVTAGDRGAFGGSSFTSAGQAQYATAFIPRSPLVCVGQFRTAMLDFCDHRPLYTTGESFPSLFVKWNAIYESGAKAGPLWTNFDPAYLMNTALWDRFFFSTIAPDVDPRGTGAPKVLKKQEQVWDEFRDKARKGVHIPLPNQHFVYNPNASRSEADKLLNKDALSESFRKSAMFLFLNGAFNINSTSENAWRAILGATRELPTVYVDSDNRASQNTDDTRARTTFHRINPVLKNDSGKPLAENNSLHDHVSWRGVKALTDDQVKKLAQALVEKIRERQSLKPFEVTYKVNEESRICRPFFSLAEFINRTIFDTTTSEVEARKGRVGVLQAAIYYADKQLSARINTGMKQDGVDLGVNSNTKLNEKTGDLTKMDVLGQGAFPYPENVNLPDNDNILMASAALGNLLQGDILETIGARLSARSDTFTIRAYGDTVTAGATERAKARAYAEAVVQRTPEYVDDLSNDPYIHPTDGMNSDIRVESPKKKELTAVNRHLGRRFRIVSIRWLTEKDL